MFSMISGSVYELPVDSYPINAELHVFQPSLVKLSKKLLLGDFGIPLFSFFEILTLNQNISSESFRLFLIPVVYFIF
jgi:hypothetical protein